MDFHFFNLKIYNVADKVSSVLIYVIPKADNYYKSMSDCNINIID